MSLFKACEGVTIFEGNRRNDRQEVISYSALFLLSLHCVEVETKTAGCP